MKSWKLSRGETGILIAAAALVLLGIVFFSVSGMMFLGYLAVEAAGVCAVWIFLCRWAKKSRAGRLCRNAVLVVLCLGILLFCIMESIIVSHGEWDNESIPADAVIVLGAGVNGEEPSPALQTRLNAAQSYMEQHPDIPVVLSGGLGIGETVAEAEVMYRALSTGEKGWDSRLLKEPRATSTAENFRYACEVLRQAGMEPEEMRIAFVTNDFHIYRAKLIAERMGLQAFGVPAELPWWWVNLTCFVREAFALVMTLIFD